MYLIHWFKRLVSGKPHFRIGANDDPYLLRWHLIPRNPWFNIYLHKFLRNDDDRALHDHPWWFCSIMVKGGYIERREIDRVSSIRWEDNERYSPSIAFRTATDKHRVTLFKNSDGTSKPCWTIVITGKKERIWGFWCPKGFIPWYQFVSKDDKGSVGKGCGE